METNFLFRMKLQLDRTLLTLLFLMMAFSASAQIISGHISDENDHPVPYATIFVSETKEGTTSNIDGNFQLQLPLGTYHLTVRSMGYLQQNVNLIVDQDSMFLPITMQVQEFELHEIKVFPGDEDPAYFIIRKAIAKAPYYREKIKHYEADLYIKANFEFTNIPAIIKKQEMDDGKKFKDYFKENVTYVIESQNKITFDYPNHYDQKVISKRTSLIGFDEPPVMGLMTSSFYEERPQNVISPLSVPALKHYDFRYEGFITVGDFDVFKIKVTPKRKSDELVDGYIYIVDRLWCIYNLDFSSSFEFVDYRIKQQFENLGNGNWLPVSHNITGNIGALGMRGTFYYGASVKYDKIEDNYGDESQSKTLTAKSDTVQSSPPKEESAKTKSLRAEVAALTAQEDLSNADVKKVARLNRKILKEQYQDTTIQAQDVYNNYNIEDQKDSLDENVAWDSVRTIPLTPAEVASYHMADSIRGLGEMKRDTSSGGLSISKSMLTKLAFGDWNFYSDSILRIRYSGFLNTENFDFNAVDGYKYKQFFQFRIHPDSAKYIFISPELGYAFNRKALFGQIETRFENIFWDGSVVQFSAGKLSRDFKDQGITPSLNAISTWFFAKNYMRLYESQFIKFNVNQRLIKNLHANASVSLSQNNPLENHASFLFNNNKEFAPNIPKGLSKDHASLIKQKSFVYALGLNYRKRIYKPWLQESPFLFITDVVEWQLKYKQGLKNVFSSVSDFSQIDFSFYHQANLSPVAGIDWTVNAGIFLHSNQLHFSDYKHFQTSEIPVAFRPFTATLQLLNDYEFGTSDKYFQVTGEYRAEYILLRYLSIINKQTWSESLHINYLTTPVLKNYVEAGYSLNNLFFIGNIGVFTGIKNGKFETVAAKVTISIND